MRKLIGLLFLILSVLWVDAAVVRNTDITFTGIPVDGNTVTINGNVRTFKNTVGIASTQVLIGATASATAQNLAAQLRAYPLTSVNISGPDGTTVRLWANLDAAMTASSSGAWGTTTVNTTTASGSPVVSPLTALDSALRAGKANQLLTDLHDFANSALNADTVFLGNFVNLSGVQTISGVKTFSGATIISNNLAMFVNGIVSNAVGTNLVLGASKLFVYGSGITPLTFELKSLAPTIQFYDTSAAANEKRAYLSQYGGQFLLKTVSDDGLTENTVFVVGRAGATPNAVTFNVPINGTVYNSGFVTNTSITNSYGGLITAWIQTLNVLGDMNVTNNAVTIQLVDSGGTADDKITKLVADNDAFEIQFFNDAGTKISTPMAITRAGAIATKVTFKTAPVDIQDGLTVGGASPVTINQNVYAYGPVISGTVAPTLPTGMTSGYYMLDGGALSGDPLTGAVFFSNAGNLYGRTSAASEGNGLNWRVFNRTALVSGSGSDYTFTTSMAFVDFGGTDPKVTLPTDGTYEIVAQVSVLESATGGDDIRFKLRNETTSTDLTSSDLWITHLAASERGNYKVVGTATATSASNVIAIWGQNNTSARGTVESARTWISYKRLY